VTTTTPVHGLERPSDSDPVREGADRLQALTDRLDLILPRTFRTGPHSVAAVDTSYTAAITFPDPYPAGVVPTVQVTAEVAAPTAIVTASGVTNTGFTLNYRRVSGTVNISTVVTTQVTT
jgi:hypothetical protein